VFRIQESSLDKVGKEEKYIFSTATRVLVAGTELLEGLFEECPRLRFENSFKFPNGTMAQLEPTVLVLRPTKKSIN
jgi:hypothetical protein